jgi:hypothetical protein
MKIQTRTTLSIFFTVALLGVNGCALLSKSYPNGTNAAPVYVPSSLASNINNGAQQVAAVVPTPYGGLLATVATLAFAGLGLFARIKTTAAANNESMLTAVISGVENANIDSVKQAVSNAAVSAGVSGILATKVQSVTSPNGVNAIDPLKPQVIGVIQPPTKTV